MDCLSRAPLLETLQAEHILWNEKLVDFYATTISQKTSGSQFLGYCRENRKRSLVIKIHRTHCTISLYVKKIGLSYPNLFNTPLLRSFTCHTRKCQQKNDLRVDMYIGLFLGKQNLNDWKFIIQSRSDDYLNYRLFVVNNFLRLSSHFSDLQRSNFSSRDFRTSCV